MHTRSLVGWVGIVLSGLGCSGAGPAGPAQAPSPTAAAVEAPPVKEPAAANPVNADATCPPRMIDLPEGGRLPATLSALGTTENDRWVTFEALEASKGDGRAAGRWLAWSAGGEAKERVDEGADTLNRLLRAATGQSVAASPREEKKARAAIARWGQGSAEHRLTLSGYVGSNRIEGDHTCAVAGAAGPLTLAEARALLPALVPEGMPEIMSELLGERRIALITARVGYSPGGEASYDVIADAAWRQAIEKRLAAVAGEKIPFTVGGAPGISYMHEEPGWKIDVYAIPEKKQIHVEADWQ